MREAEKAKARMGQKDYGKRRGSRSGFNLEKSLRGIIQDSPALRLATMGVLAVSVVALGALVANSFHSASADATLIGGLVSAPDPAISASLNNADLSAIVQPGSFSSLSNTLTVSTSYPTGYSLSLSASSANIDHSAGSNTGSILATSGTFASPSALSSSSGNAWGYAIDQNTTSTNANTVVNGFSSSYSTPTASLNWASANTAGTTIKATNQVATNDTTTVYYGVNTASNLTAGTYTDTVTLTALANTGDIIAPTITSVSPTRGLVSGGGTITIYGTNFSYNGASITSAVKIGDNDCTNVQIYKDSTNNSEYITCTVPANATAGNYNVSVSNWTATTTLTNGYTYKTAPEATITSTSDQKATSQTATLSCTDSIGVNAYYFGTSTSPADTDYTTIDSTTSYSTTKTVSSAGTYYLFCKDVDGNTSTSVNKVYYSYNVYNMWITVTGTQTTYTTANYTQSSNTTYIAPSGTTLTMSSIYTTPNSTYATYIGYATTQPSSSTSATIASTSASATATLNANSTFSFWWNRVNYTITAAITPAGYGTVTVAGQRSQSSTSSITVRYGESVTATASPASGKKFTKWTGASTATTNPVTVANTTSNKTFTGNFANAGPTTMQEMTKAYCQSMSTNSTIELKDTRGHVLGSNTTYTIKKMADGNCWMIDNLRLPGGTTITSSDSDVTSNYTLPSSSTSGFDSDTGQFMYDNPNNTNGYDSSYYSWLVAVAKTSSPSSTQYYNVPTSICPKGWHLPSAYGASSQAGQSSSSVNGQFRNLYTAYSSTVSTFNTGFNSVFAGLYYSSSFYSGGSRGYWWSSTVSSSAYAYYLYALSSNVNPSYYDNRRNGRSIRCVLAS